MLDAGKMQDLRDLAELTAVVTQQDLRRVDLFLEDVLLGGDIELVGK